MSIVWIEIKSEQLLKEIRDKITEKDENDVIIDDNNNDVHMANDEEIYDFCFL